MTEAVGGRFGCFHILAPAQCLPLAVRAASARLCGAALRMPEASENVVRDGCVAWRAESPHWARVEETPGNGFRSFRREIRITAQSDERPRLRMTAALRDEGRELSSTSAKLTLVLETPTFTIVEATAELSAAPFAGCREPIAGAERLEGLFVNKGFTSVALARVGGATGCAHLSALLIALTPVIPQASGALAGLMNLRFGQNLRERASNPRAGSCHMWRLDGPLAGLERSLNPGESV